MFSLSTLVCTTASHRFAATTAENGSIKEILTLKLGCIKVQRDQDLAGSCWGWLPWLVALACCSDWLPWLVAVVGCRGWLPWLVAVSGCGTGCY